MGLSKRFDDGLFRLVNVGYDLQLYIMKECYPRVNGLFKEINQQQLFAERTCSRLYYTLRIPSLITDFDLCVHN